MKGSGKSLWALASVFILAVIVASLVYLSWARGAQDVSTTNNNSGIGIVPDLYLDYFYSAETVYDKITINGSRLTYTYFDYANATLDPYDMSQMAHYDESDLKTLEADLSADEVNRLIGLIDDTRFMSLDDTYGGAGDRQRYYPYTLTVGYRGKNKTVVYRSFPWATPAPAGFVAMQEALAGLVMDKFGKRAVKVANHSINNNVPERDV